MEQKDEYQYKTTVPDEHWRDEEYQWVRILAKGNAARGMVLLYIQKACTAFHEFEPAFNADAVKGEKLEFFKGRLAKRIGHVLTTMENNDLDGIDGVEELREILRQVESAERVNDLAELSERVHAVNHTLLDALEAIGA